MAERRHFLRHAQAYWDIHRHRIAPEVAATLERLLLVGQLTLRAGRVESLHERSGEVEAIIRPRGTTRLETVTARAVIVCTGPSGDYAALDDPLIGYARQSGILRPHPLRFGVETDEHGALLDAAGQPSPWLFTLGPPRTGMLWESTALPEIRVQAATLATYLIANLTATAS